MENNKLICPFCQQELQTWAKYTDGTSKLWCSKCNLFGDSKLFSELIRTRKALELAITGLKNCKTRDHIGAVCRTPEYIDKILEQITAEQKD